MKRTKSFKKNICKLVGHVNMFLSCCTRCGYPFSEFEEAIKNPWDKQILFEHVVNKIYRLRNLKIRPCYGDYEPAGYYIMGRALDKRRAAIRTQWIEDINKEVSRRRNLRKK